MTMILDIARHKFYEALLALLFASGVMVLIGILSPCDVSMMADSATPLSAYIMHFSQGNRVLSAIAASVLCAAGALVLTRSTLRSPIFPSRTMAVISLFPLLMLPVIIMGDVLVYGCVSLLSAISVSRLLKCYGPHVSSASIFMSLLSAGVLPLLDVSLVVVPLLLMVAVIASRATFRESVIAIVAALLPIFAWCYIMWCCGGTFADELLFLWRLVIGGSQFAWFDLITIPLLIFLLYTALLLAAVIWRYFVDRTCFNGAVRSMWATLFLLIVVVVATFVLLPSSSPALLVVLMVTVVSILPLLFLSLSTPLSLAAYLLLFVLSIVAAI